MDANNPTNVINVVNDDQSECSDVHHITSIDAAEVYGEVLNRSVRALPSITLATEFDYFHDLPMQIANEFHLSKEDISYMRA